MSEHFELIKQNLDTSSIHTHHLYIYGKPVAIKTTIDRDSLNYIISSIYLYQITHFESVIRYLDQDAIIL